MSDYKETYDPNEVDRRNSQDIVETHTTQPLKQHYKALDRELQEATRELRAQSEKTPADKAQNK